jgi:glutamyl-tRNA reductase
VRIILVGMNHRTAPVEVRERFAVADPGPTLVKLVDDESIEEAVVLSTCNRVEVVVTTTQPDAARMRLRRFFESTLHASGEASRADLDDHLYWFEDRQAVSHVFRVSSAIDSMVVGEAQILGQVKDAYRAALEARSCGPILSRLFQRAFATAKRVKSETRISERPVSVARVAVELARQIFERLDDKTAVLIGAGDMIETALFALQREGLADHRVLNRTRSRAEALARRFGGTAHGLDELDERLVEADVVLTCIGGDDPILQAESMQETMRRRRWRPMFLIDMGVPRNVAPGVEDVDGVYLYDMDDLQDVSTANVEQRERESMYGERIVAEEEERFDGWLAALRAVPTIRHLRARAEAVRRSEIDRLGGRLGLDDDQRDGVEALTRAIVNKLLHSPLSRLGALSDRESGLAVLQEARALFALDDAAAPGADVDPEILAELDEAGALARAFGEAPAGHGGAGPGRSGTRDDDADDEGGPRT